MDKIMEYQFFAESSEKLSERRQAATQTYMTVNTAIFAVLTFLVNDAGFRSWGLFLVSLPLFLVGCAACLIWYRIIIQYKRLIGWRYEQLIAFERSDVMKDSLKIYSREWDEFFCPKDGKESFGFSRLEIWLPALFFGLYIIYALVLIGAILLSSGQPAQTVVLPV